MRRGIRVLSSGERMELSLLVFFDGPSDIPLPDGPLPEPPLPRPPIPDPPWPDKPIRWWLDPKWNYRDLSNLHVMSTSGTCAEKPGFYCDLNPKDLDDPQALADLNNLIEDPGPEGYLRQLRELIEMPIATPSQRYRKFFATYDANTHRVLIPAVAAPMLVLPGYASDTRLNDITDASSALTIGVFLRWKFPDASADFSEIDTTVEPDYAAACEFVKDRIGQLSTLQLEFFAQLAPGGDSDELAAASAEAFAHFANGSLRLQLKNKFWTTQPSSAFFFHFAQFAFAACKVDVPEHFQWQRILPGLVAAQEVFQRVYRPNVQSPHFDDYRACNYDVMQVYSTSEMNALAAKYAPWANLLASASSTDVQAGLNGLAKQMGANLKAACPAGVPIVT